MAHVAHHHSEIHPPDLPLFDWASKRCTATKRKVVSWRVNRWLGVERVEVR